MREAREEMLQSLNESNLEKMRKAAKGAKQTLKMKDGSIGMDSFTASAIMQIYDKINDKNKKTFENMMNNGKKADIMKLAKFAMSKVNAEYVPEDFEEEVELDEAKYDLYHKDFSSAMQHAYAMAKKLYGITIDPKEIDDKVATGPRKPGTGKTNRYRLKGDKGTIQVQVYNRGGDNKLKYPSRDFELNMYKEEVELDEARKSQGMFIVLEKGSKNKVIGQFKEKDKAMEMMKKNAGSKVIQIGKFATVDDKPVDIKVGDNLSDTRVKLSTKIKEEVELDEKPADFIRLSFNSPADVKKAKKWMDENLPGANQGFTGIDASGKDIEFEDVDDAEDLMSKLKKAGFRFKVDYREEAELDEKLDKEDEPTIKKVVKMLKKASGAHAGQAKDLEKAMTEEDKLDEGKMKQLHQLMKDGKSAKEIAKIMKLDVKTIQALMDEKSELEENLDGRTREYRQHRERLELMRSKRQDEKRHIDPADIDTSATDDDIKAADKNIMMQLRKSVSLRGQFPVEFLDKKKVKIPQKIAQAVIAKYNSLRKPMDKEVFQSKIAKSHRDLLMALKEGFASDAQRRAAFAQGYKAKGKKDKKEDIDETGYVGGKDPMPAGKELAKLMKKRRKGKKESTLERMNKKLQEKKDG